MSYKHLVNNKTTILLLVFLFVANLFINVQDVKADCSNTDSMFDCGSPEPPDTCVNTLSGGSNGAVFYSFRNDYCACNPDGSYDGESVSNCNDSGPGYSYHRYTCDTPCSSGGNVGGSCGICSVSDCDGKDVGEACPGGTCQVRESCSNGDPMCGCGLKSVLWR